MNARRDPDRLIHAFLMEGATELADDVYDTVRDHIEHTRQRAVIGPWREPDMNPYLKIALAAAAVVIVAVVGIRQLGPGVGGSSIGGPAPTATTGPTATPAVTPTPSIAPALGALSPGTYRIGDATQTAVPFTFTVPAGWTARADGYVYKNADQPDELGFDTSVVTRVYADACKSKGTLTEVGPKADDLVRALVDQVGSKKSAPVDATLGGRPAKRIDISVPPDLDSATCRNPGELIQIWANSAETEFFAIPLVYPAGVVQQVYTADVNGRRAVIVTGTPAAASAADVAELKGVMDSLRFE